MEKRNAIAVAASIALVSLAGATTIGTNLADRGGDDPAPAVTAATAPATPVLTTAASVTDDRVSSDDGFDDDRARDDDDGSDDDGGHGRGRGRGRGGDDD